MTYLPSMLNGIAIVILSVGAILGAFGVRERQAQIHQLKATTVQLTERLEHHEQAHLLDDLVQHCPEGLQVRSVHY